MIFAHHWINHHIIFLIGIEKETNLEKRNNDIRWEFFQIRVKKIFRAQIKQLNLSWGWSLYWPRNEYYFLYIQISVSLVKVEEAQKLRALFNENCSSLKKVKFPTDQVRPALGSCCRLIVVNHAQKTSKLPFFRLFRPDTQILSALTALYWPSTPFYWPSTTK